MFLTAQELVEVSKSSDLRSLIYNYRHNGINGWLYSHIEGPLNLTTAQELLDNVRAATLASHQRKVNRPWELVDVTSGLDPQQAWVGIEFETGWGTQDAYHRACNYVFDNFNHTVIDLEGYGGYAAEITFAPENLSTFDEGTSKMQQFLSWLNTDGPATLQNGPGYMIGTHANISTPAYRAMWDEEAGPLNRILRRSLFLMRAAQLVECFGRSPYGANNMMGSGTSKWIEFKLFDSTSNVEQFNRYVRSIKGLTKVIDKMIETRCYLDVNVNVIANLGDFLLGNAETLQLGFVPVHPTYFGEVSRENYIPRLLTNRREV